MKLSDEQLIAAPRARVWAALNDPDVLKQSIPGCESITKTSDTSFTARVMVKVGPVKARFTGAVDLSDLDPPESYRISGQGQGGIAGFARGSAAVRLVETSPSETRMQYDVDAQVGGKLALIGSRLVDSTARSMAMQFFDRFARLVARPAVEPVAAARKVRKPGKKKAAKKPARKPVRKLTRKGARRLTAKAARKRR